MCDALGHASLAGPLDLRAQRAAARPRSRAAVTAAGLLSRKRPRPPPSHVAADPRAAVGSAAPAAPLLGAAADAAGGGDPPYDASRRVRLAVVGDVHGAWGAADEAALRSLRADLAVFVGDFGDEDAGLVARVAALDHPKAVVLGNHDAWYSLTPRGRRRAAAAGAAAAAGPLEGRRAGDDRVSAMLAALGRDHVGYACRRLDAAARLSLLGGRPFSKGGDAWADVAAFYAARYGVGSMADSAARVARAGLAAPAGDALVAVAHNGPAGLGARRSDPCGRDWEAPPADWGDRDLADALGMLAAQGRRVPLVLFGHMHGALAPPGGRRDMAAVDAATGTVFLNAAVVPRVRRRRDGGRGRARHFLVVELAGRGVAAAEHVWVGRAGGGGGGGGGCEGEGPAERWEVLEREPAVVAAPGDDGRTRVVSAYRAFTGGWDSVVVGA